MNILSTCTFQEADIAFFPLLSHAYQLLDIPKDARDKNILGVIEAPPVVSQRLYLKKENNRTFCCKNRPLEFSVFTPLRVTEQGCQDYWGGLMSRIQKSAFPTFWVFMPEEAITLIFNHIIQGQGMFYAYKPTDKLPGKHFLLANGEKGLYSYHLVSPKLSLVTLN